MHEARLQLLSVTGDPTISQVLHRLASSESWNVAVFEGAAGIFSANLDDAHLILLDEASTGPNYAAIVKKARRRFPAADITVVGGPKSDDVRVSDRRAGVDYYIERPVEEARLGTVLSHRQKIAELKSAAGIVGRSPLIEDIIEAILQVGPTEVPILIEG